MKKTDTKSTPVPGAVQAKMQQGLPQRYAMATTPSVVEKGKK